MNLNWQRIALLIGFILAVLLIGYGLYFIFLRPAVPTTTPGDTTGAGTGSLPTTNVGGGIPVAGNVNATLPTGTQGGSGQPGTEQPAEASTIARGGLTQSSALTTSAAIRPTLSADGGRISYYDPTTGRFYQLTTDGRITPLSEEVFFEVQNITWSPSKSKAVLEYPDGANIVYDFNTKKQYTLPQHWKDFSFSPDSERVVVKSIGTSVDNRWLAVSDSDGSEATRLKELGDQDATVYNNWSPNGQIVAMYSEDINFDQQRLFFVGLNDENFQSTVIEGRGFQGQWSSSGDTLLYSVYSSETNYNPTLWIVDANAANTGQNRRSLKLQTWADKCTFANDTTVYCAVPQALVEGSGFFQDDLNVAPSDIYKIDLTSGIKTKIATPESNLVAENIIVDKNQSNLYFTDRFDGRLYTVRLR